MKFLTKILLISSFWFPAQAHAFSVHHDFACRLGVFDPGSIGFTYNLTPETYAVTSTIKTGGFFDTLYPFKAVYNTTGRIDNDKLETASYKYQSASRFTTRTRELIYDKNGQPLYETSSKNGKEKKKTVTWSKKTDEFTDLQTIIAEMVKRYNKLKSCDSQMQVFDGKRRYKVIFKEDGQEQLKKNEFSPLEGTATKCSLYIDKLAETGDDLLWQITSDKPIYFWILEQDGHPFIARIEVKETPLGPLRLYAQKITIKE